MLFRMTRLGLASGLLLVGLEMSGWRGGAADDAAATYRDAALGFTYRYPSGFQAQPALPAALAKGLAANEDDPNLAKCITMPLGLMKGEQTVTAGGELAILTILKIDHTCLGEPGAKDKLGPAAQMLMKMISPFGRPVTENAVYYRLDGHDAAFVQGSAAAKVLGEGRMMHEAAVCTLLGTATVCWVLIDTEYKLMPGLVANPVTFDGRAPVALVPKDIPQAW